MDHANQESLSRAIITWNNAFSAINRVLSAVGDFVEWNGVALALNTMFGFETGQCLTTDDLNYLGK